MAQHKAGFILLFFPDLETGEVTADFPFQLPGSLYDHSCGVAPSKSGRGFDLVLAGGAFGYSYIFNCDMVRAKAFILFEN